MQYFIGAYAASPTSYGWDQNIEAKYLEGIRSLPIRGLEIPFTGDLHPHTPAWFRDQLPKHWDFSLTCIPGTMDRIKLNPQYGLASLDSEGRKSALEFTFKAIDNAKKFNDYAGRNSIRYLQIHSAPKSIAKKMGSTEQFADSIEKILQYNSDQLIINIEHCDSFKPEKETPKAFLSLEEEIQAVRQLHTKNIGFLVNWGRSAIDGESSNTPINHIKQLESEGLLRGLFFSGCTINDPEYGDWQDTHAPFADPDAKTKYPQSILTQTQVVESLKTLDNIYETYIGIKMQFLPKSLDVYKRVQCVKDSIRFLDDCVKLSI